DVAVDAVILGFAVAVDDADLGAGAKSGAQVAQESDGLGDLVVGLQEQNGVDLVGGQEGVVFVAEDGVHVMELFFLGAVFDVVDGFGVDVDGVDTARVCDAAGGKDGEEAGSG